MAIAVTEGVGIACGREAWGVVDMGHGGHDGQERLRNSVEREIEGGVSQLGIVAGNLTTSTGVNL